MIHELWTYEIISTVMSTTHESLCITTVPRKRIGKINEINVCGIRLCGPIPPI